MINKVTIYGERCSGTNYLEQLLITNFDIEITWQYGWKHFFGFDNYTDSDNILFIGIVRNLVDWINSFFVNQYHILHLSCKENFLNSEFYSVYDNNEENLCDRNMYTKKRYINIFDMRHTKNKYLVEDIPKLVKKYLLITYDELIENFGDTMNKIKNMNLPVKNMNLPVKNNIDFPLNIKYYKNYVETPYVKQKYNNIPEDIIIKKANMYYENILFNKNNIN